jgi:EmrB/QacA subfamily drug resistance transporter
MDTTLTTVTTATPDRRRWLALTVVLIAALVDAVDVTVVHIAVPTIQRDIHAAYAAIQWIVGAYALTFALGLIMGGRLGDLYGRKRVFLLGMAGFIAASLLAGVATGPGMLIVARLLQGAMAALMIPQVLATIHVTFAEAERGKAFAIYGAVLGIGVVIGPVLGGLIVSWNLFGLGWRPIFLVNLPIGILGLVLGAGFMRESRAEHARQLDVLGVGWAASGLFLLIFPLTQGRDLGWPWWGYLMMIASTAVLAGFVIYQRVRLKRGDWPLVQLSLFRARKFSAGLSVQLLFGIMSGLFFLGWTLYLQAGLGWSARHAALTGLPMSLGIIAGSGLSMQLLVPRFGRRVLSTGAILAVAGLAIYMVAARRYGADIASSQMSPPLLVMGLGMGLIIAPLTELTMVDVPHADAGSASGLLSTVTQAGLALGIALSSVTFFGAMASHAPAITDAIAPQLKERLITAGAPAAEARARVAAFRTCTIDLIRHDNPTSVSAACGTSTRVTPAVAKILNDAGKRARVLIYSATFRGSLWYVMVAFAGMFILMFALPQRVRRRPDGAQATGEAAGTSPPARRQPT